MPRPLAEIVEGHFARGIVRVEDRGPANSVYDAVNAYLDDEGALVRRGGTVYQSTAAGGTIVGVSDNGYAPGRRTLFWLTDTLYVLGSDDTTPVVINTTDHIQPCARPGAVRGMAVLPCSNTPEYVVLYGGSRKASYSTGTITLTEGSTTVTGVGTAWAANADRGMLLKSSNNVYVVDSVVSDTELRLRDAFGHTSVVGAAYTLAATHTIQTQFPSFVGDTAVCTVGTLGRIVVAYGSIAQFSGLGADPATGAPVFAATDFHSLPVPCDTLGVASIRDSVFWFTSAGVWRISNMNYDLTDDAGNVQQTVTQVNSLILAGRPDTGGAAGVVATGDSLIVPTTDDIVVMGPDGGTRSIGSPHGDGGILPLYRDYIASGYVAGGAVIFRGHYFLPIIDTSLAVQDVLMCRLDTGAWTRLAGHAASRAWTVRARNGTSAPLLLGSNGTRVTNLSVLLDGTGGAASRLNPAAGTADADGSAITFTVQTRKFAAHPELPAFFKRACVRYNCWALATNPQIDVTGDGPAAGVTATLAENIDTNGTYGTIAPLGRSQWVNFTFTCTGFPSALWLRSIHLFLRPVGRQ